MSSNKMLPAEKGTVRQIQPDMPEQDSAGIEFPRHFTKEGIMDIRNSVPITTLLQMTVLLKRIQCSLSGKQDTVSWMVQQNMTTSSGDR